MQKETREYVINIDKVHKNILNPEHFHSLFSKKNLTIGQKAADILTKFAGSWTFIIIFGLILILWVITNGYFLIKWYQGAFDPYPFILLNLFLSCLAAIQAPIILMSQNREGERDRIRMHYDYAVNRKAEKEIRELQKDISDIKRKMNVK
ncbi:DUF1003 domain-containing protein [Candidatus Pacearchaeota archaeon]|nr:DUF1003 domain-containing protein [Candidatus Pacearchaeota archaeon]